MIPQIILIVIFTIDLGYVGALHGQPQKYKYDMGAKIFETILFGALLYFGGFFDPMFK